MFSLSTHPYATITIKLPLSRLACVISSNNAITYSQDQTYYFQLNKKYIFTKNFKDFQIKITKPTPHPHHNNLALLPLFI